MQLEELVKIGPLFKLIHRQIQTPEHVLHLLNLGALAAHVVLWVQRVDKIENRARQALPWALKIPTVLVIETIIERDLVQKLAWALVWQISGDGGDHKEEGVSLESPKEMVVEVESFADLFEHQKQRFNLGVSRKSL